MTTPTHTHDEICRNAYQLWQDNGCPAGRATEFWLAAEQTLSEDPHARSGSPAVNQVESSLSPAETEQKSIRSAVRKDAARAPRIPHHIGPKTTPAKTGKPLWPLPHSS